MAGELVNRSGTVVDVVNPTTSNSFILTAPNSGKYLVNAGYKMPSRNWDSVSVDIDVTSIDPNHESDGWIESFKLSQNYPNPFNPETSIKYSIPSKMDVEILIYNSLGQKIKTLVNKAQQAGFYKAGLDGSNEAGYKVSAGIYFYRFKAGDFSVTKKMVMVK